MAPAGTKDYTVVRDFEPSRTYTMPKPEEDVTLRVVARAAKSTDDKDAWAYHMNLEAR